MSTEVVRKKDTVIELQRLMEANRDRLNQMLPKHLTPERLLNVTMAAVKRTPKLQQCSVQSIITAMVQCGQMGLEPETGLQQAYLVPFGQECVLIVGYRGLLQLVRNAEELAGVEAHVVYERDEFEVSYGLNPVFKHRPNLTSERGKPVATWCCFSQKDGHKDFTVMAEFEIQRIKSRSRAANNGPWVTDEDEMRKKTVLRRGAKLQPASLRQLHEALDEEDRAVERGEQPDMNAFLPEATGTAQATQNTSEVLRQKIEEQRKPPAQEQPEPYNLSNMPNPITETVGLDPFRDYLRRAELREEPPAPKAKDQESAPEPDAAPEQKQPQEEPPARRGPGRPPKAKAQEPAPEPEPRVEPVAPRQPPVPSSGPSAAILRRLIPFVSTTDDIHKRVMALRPQDAPPGPLTEGAAAAWIQAIVAEFDTTGFKWGDQKPPNPDAE